VLIKQRTWYFPKRALLKGIGVAKFVSKKFKEDFAKPFFCLLPSFSSVGNPHLSLISCGCEPPQALATNQQNPWFIKAHLEKKS
jgi:hypothetical protein